MRTVWFFSLIVVAFACERNHDTPGDSDAGDRSGDADTDSDRMTSLGSGLLRGISRAR